MTLNTFNTLFDTGIDEDNGYYTETGILIERKPIVNRQVASSKVKAGIPASVDYVKNKIFLEQIVFKYHPGYTYYQLQAHLRELNPDHFRIERLVEEALAYMGGYNYIDEIGRDFDDIDNSDSKTTSLNALTGIAELSGLRAKIGSLRISIYNPFEQCIDMFYMKYEDWQDKATKVFSKSKKYNVDDLRLRFVYSVTTKSYNQFDQYKVPDFFTLATKMDPEHGTSAALPTQHSLF
jgi:hypothetical protein